MYNLQYRAHHALPTGPDLFYLQFYIGVMNRGSDPPRIRMDPPYSILINTVDNMTLSDKTGPDRNIITNTEYLPSPLYRSSVEPVRRTSLSYVQHK